MIFHDIVFILIAFSTCYEYLHVERFDNLNSCTFVGKPRWEYFSRKSNSPNTYCSNYYPVIYKPNYVDQNFKSISFEIVNSTHVMFNSWLETDCIDKPYISFTLPLYICFLDPLGSDNYFRISKKNSTSYPTNWNRVEYRKKYLLLTNFDDEKCQVDSYWKDSYLVMDSGRKDTFSSSNYYRFVYLENQTMISTCNSEYVMEYVYSDRQYKSVYSTGDFEELSVGRLPDLSSESGCSTYPISYFSGGDSYIASCVETIPETPKKELIETYVQRKYFLDSTSCEMKTQAFVREELNGFCFNYTYFYYLSMHKQVLLINSKQTFDTNEQLMRFSFDNDICSFSNLRKLEFRRNSKETCVVVDGQPDYKYSTSMSDIYYKTLPPIYSSSFESDARLGKYYFIANMKHSCSYYISNPEEYENEIKTKFYLGTKYGSWMYYYDNNCLSGYYLPVQHTSSSITAECNANTRELIVTTYQQSTTCDKKSGGIIVTNHANYYCMDSQYSTVVLTCIPETTRYYCEANRFSDTIYSQYSKNREFCNSHGSCIANTCTCDNSNYCGDHCEECVGEQKKDEDVKHKDNDSLSGFAVFSEVVTFIVFGFIGICCCCCVICVPIVFVLVVVLIIVLVVFLVVVVVIIALIVLVVIAIFGLGGAMLVLTNMVSLVCAIIGFCSCGFSCCGLCFNVGGKKKVKDGAEYNKLEELKADVIERDRKIEDLTVVGDSSISREYSPPVIQEEEEENKMKMEESGEIMVVDNNVVEEDVSVNLLTPSNFPEKDD